jgi:hypothetical protein
MPATFMVNAPSASWVGSCIERAVSIGMFSGATRATGTPSPDSGHYQTATPMRRMRDAGKSDDMVYWGTALVYITVDTAKSVPGAPRLDALAVYRAWQPADARKMPLAGAARPGWCIRRADGLHSGARTMQRVNRQTGYGAPGYSEMARSSQPRGNEPASRPLHRQRIATAIAANRLHFTR